MQKNLPLPKLPDQICYYSRQLYCYNLTVVSGISTGKEALKKENVSVYTWCEHEMRKSSNEIASAVYNELQSKLNAGSFDGINTIRLVADGCSGQNKNSMLMTMVLLWLHRSPEHIKRIEVVYPVTGHSFMPSDRVFGFIERVINKNDTITDVKVYREAFAAQGVVKQLGKDWENFDWRTETKNCIKDTKDLHFKISRVRRLVFTKQEVPKRITVQGEMQYPTDTANAETVTKKGKRISMINPDQLKIGVKVKPTKLSDVENLLKAHYGNEWSEIEGLKWYNNILSENRMMPEVPGFVYDDVCECADEANVEDVEIFETVLEHAA